MNGAVEAWRGIRFADLAHPFAAPVLRPIRGAIAPGGMFGPAPMQTPVNGYDLRAEVSTTDCLSLNIWAPPDAHGLPVAVWLFGGGFEIGAASAAWFDGEELARVARCVVVTVNYRVGTFGFGHFARHGGLLADAHDLGLRDVLTALTWVTAHVDRFGGDPDRVTLLGQSAGAFLAAAAATSPCAPRLAAIGCFSGGASRIVAERDAETFADDILAELGLQDRPQEIVQASPADILTAQAAAAPRDLAIRNGARPRGFGISADTSTADPLVPRHPMAAVRAGALRETFVLAAAGIDEMDGFDPNAVPPVGDGGLEGAIRDLAGAVPHDALPAYGGEQTSAAWRQVLGDYIYRLPAVRLVDAQRASGGRGAYLDLSRDGAVRATHGAETPGIFGRGTITRDATVQRAIVSLIRDGDIVGGGIDQPLRAGDPLPPESVRAAELMRIWEGIDRP
jgi:para-nitrobenzyl esterase